MPDPDPFALVDYFSDRTGCGRKVCTHDSDTASKARSKYPQFGWCLRCGMPNSIAPKNKGVKCGPNEWMQPLCDICFVNISHKELGYYCLALYRSHMVGHLDAAFNSRIRIASMHPTWQAVLSSLRQMQSKS